MNAKAGVGIMTLLAVVVVVVVAVFAVMQYAPPTKAEITGTEALVSALAADAACGDDDLGYFRPAIYNPLNTSATEYISATMRVYQVVGTEEVFFGTVATQTSGIVARAATGSLQVSCVDASGEIIKYKAYVPASDGSITSAVVEFVASEDIPMEISIPQQAGLLFKVYDNDNKGYVYASAATTANAWAATGTTFYSTTSNSSGLAIGTDGSFDYDIIVSQNATAATDTQFEDQATYLYTNMDDLSDWNELDISGVTVDGIDFPNTKIANAGYDFAYELTSNGNPLHIGTAKVSIGVAGQALSGVDASDDITVAFGTSGYYKQTVGSGMVLDTNKDDSAQTTVYTLQTVILDLD